MDKLTNTESMKHVINTLFKIVSRRTSESYSNMIILDIFKTLENKFEFLKYVKIKKIALSEHDFDMVNIIIDLNKIDSKEVGNAIESIIRVASANMKDKDAGLYFITELKDQIQDKYIPWLKENGTDIDLIQIEHHYLYKQRSKKELLPSTYRKLKHKEKNKSTYASLINYTWDKVAFWEYDDNVCTIFDKKGKILDRIPLDKIIKDFIIEITGFDKFPLNSDKLVELNEKEYEFIKLLYSKDMNAEEAMHLLGISRKELSVIVRKLLVYEILQYVSHDMVMLTENGIEALIKK